jgi:hypothetical protein
VKLFSIKGRHPDGRPLTRPELIEKLNAGYDQHLAILHQRNRGSLLESDLDVDQIVERLQYLDAANEDLRGEYLSTVLAHLEFISDTPGATEH